MSEVLYRKYRPRTFAEVIGQDAVKAVLQNALKLGRISHAYLFSGPRGVGKTTVARLLAKAVNCLKPSGGEPDAKCENCIAVQNGRFLDLLEIDAASYTGVENIRDIIDHVKFSPSQGKYKVFIIDEVHMLSKAAFNALLKTLEEPPAHAIFILATTEIHKVPPTIISRAQRFDFKRVSAAEIFQLFSVVLRDLRLKVVPEAQALIAQAAEGSFRDALSILDQLLSFGEKEITVDRVEETLGLTRIATHQNFLDLLLGADAPGASKFVKILAYEGRDLVQFIRNFLEYLRLLLYVKMALEDAAALGLSPEEQAKVLSQSQALPGAQLLAIIKAMLEAYRETRLAPVPELPLLLAVGKLLQNSEASPRPAEPADEGRGKGAKDKKPDLHLKLGTIVDRWAEVLSRVKEYNRSLLGSLRLGRIVRLKDGELTLAFPYNFHKETVEARKNRIVVEQVLEEVFDRKVQVKVYLERELPREEESGGGGGGGDLLNEALKVLGE